MHGARKKIKIKFVKKYVFVICWTFSNLDSEDMRVYRDADKFLARPGSKQSTATKL